MKKRIAVLFHEGDKKKNLGMYSIVYMAKTWMNDGHEVVFVFGTRTFTPADIVVVHVDLSVVPDEYLEFARRYPRSINGELKDIRKSQISKNLLKIGDPYDGKVIVKTDLNFAGLPESWLGSESFIHKPLFGSPRNYPVYSHLKEVPRFFLDSPDYIVEKFLPEINDGLFVMRFYQFLGDNDNCFSMASKNHIVNASSCVKTEKMEPNPEIRHIRKSMKLDYGKLDYVINNGKVIVHDVNKTTGFWATSAMNRHLNLEKIYHDRAQGIYSYFE